MRDGGSIVVTASLAGLRGGEGAGPGPESIREPEEVFLVDRVQHRSRRPLDDLVLQGGDRQRTLPAIRLGDIDPPARQRPIRSPLDPRMQVGELALVICCVVLPGHPIHPGGRALLQIEERLLDKLDPEMVVERGESLLFPLPCGLPYAAQRLGHACPVLCPARAVPARISFGRRPWLHRLRSGAPHLVRRLHSYYGGV
ncbi:hypothetical protein [Labrys wisconsinensis]|uniref:hypothetical protein n=1 Tax=Labrys wisconsinensis TaxID=425677 RepID=UPI003522836E